MKHINRVVGVTFVEGYNSKVYKYFCPYEVEVGDKVIVDSPSNGYVTVEIVSIMTVDVAAKKRVVNVIDDSDYLDHLEREQKKAEILAQLEVKKKAMEEVAIYKMLAAEDPEAAKLLIELESL